MDKKLMGTAAVIGVVAGYMYSKDIFNSATFAAPDSKCVNGQYKTQPTPDSRIHKKQSYTWVKITGPTAAGYTVTRIKHYKAAGGKAAYDRDLSVDLRKDTYPTIEGAMKAAHHNKKGSPKGYIHDLSGDYCKSLAETVEEEKPIVIPASDDNQEDKPPETEGYTVTSSGSTDWCAIKAKYPARIKEIKGEIAEERIKIKADYVTAVNKVKDLNRETSEKFEKEGAAELKRIKDRYTESKKKCSAKEEVQKKLKDADIGEGFWEKLLAFLNA